MSHCYSSVHLTLLVTVLLSGASQLVSCSYEENGLQDTQLVSKTRHEIQLVAATSRDADDGWRMCGKLDLSSKYRIHAADGVQNVLQHHTESMDVALLPDSGILRCRCRQHRVSPPSVDTANHKVAIVVQVVDSKDNHFKISLPLEPVSCQVSYCRRNPTALFTIKQQKSINERTSLQLNSDCTSMLSKEYSSPLSVRLLRNGAVVLSALPTANLRRKNSSLPWAHGVGQTSVNSGILLQNQYQLGQKCSIDVIQSIKLINGTGSPYTHDINFTRLLPLELTNCINLLNDHQATVRPSTVLLSVRPWLSNHDTMFAGHNSRGSYHAELSTTTGAVNAIHEKGGRIVSESAAKHRARVGASKIREVRQVSTAPLEFNDTFYMASVFENSPLGTVVITVRATGNGPIIYTMTPDSSFSTGLFTMNSSTGVVTTTDNLDREMQSTHTFRIQAQEMMGGRSSIVQMTITVKDENDNTPTFERPYFNLTVEEDEERTYVIHRFTVIDPDAGLNGMIEYTLINDTDNTFTVTEAGSQVALSLNKQVNFEAQRFYLLTITAKDRGSSPRSSFATFDIHVIDVADSIPQFNATSYSREVAENASPSTYLLTVHATSQDSAPLATLQYIKVSGDSDNQFSIDSNTGVITLTKSLDFETLQFHVLVVQAQSVVNPSLQSQTNVHITVTNINDHSPVFTRPVYSISVLETVSTQHLVITVDAPDSDEGVFGQVSYQFAASTEQAINDTFMLNRMSGQVTTIRRLDREQREQYSFIVVAMDRGTPPRSSTSRVSITVSDVNDEPPVFSQQQYIANISENLDVGRSVTQVFAEDRDSAVSVVNYYIQSGNINSAFGIDSQDGLIRTRIRLDREDQARYNLLVLATDGNNENTTRVLITVLDVNDETPTFDLSLYNPPPISEGLGVDSEVLRVEATDLDEGSNGEVTYTSTNIDQKFSLNSATGTILLALSLDYEENTRYNFDVMATDSGRPPRSSTARVQIAVFDVNDNSPVFEPHPSTFNIPENLDAGIVVTILIATDADSGSNAIVQYEIIGDSQAIRAFGIRQNGVIDTRESLDREIISQYELVIQASDSGAVRQTETTRLTVNVEDKIDYPPVFSQVVYEVSITSVHSRGLPVVTVQASTRDMVLPQSIIYRITSGANATLFRMDQITGMIFAVTNIDPVLHKGVYRLGIEARHQHLSESVFVIVRVMLDDGIPRIRPLTLYFSAYSTLIGPMNHLGVVEIDQPKEGQEYAFSLLYSDPRVQRLFLINPTTGSLSVADRVLSGHYQLNISATTSTGVGFGLVEVFVSILTNQTLENTIVATFGGAREASFASIQLDQFIQFLMEIIPCSRSQVEVISIQRSGLERDEMVSLAFSILEPSLTSYIAQDRIIDTLLANRHNARPSTLLTFISDVCSEESCQNLQRCQPIIEIHRGSHASPFRIISGTYHFHSFQESHICSCPEGYSQDDLCSSEVNECNPSPCYFGAECTDYVGDYQCECPFRTYGKNCSTICTSQESCDLCNPNPCLYEGICHPLLNLASYSCDACPWGNGYNGPDCELTTLHFTRERSSFVAFQTSMDTARLDLDFQFATISPNGLLFYSGNLGDKDDYIAAELVIGQLRVGASFGGVATMLTTDSIWNLNDGQWRSVSIKLRNRVLMVEVSDCSDQSQFLQGAIETCSLEATLPSESGRTLELNSLLYFGGLEPHVTHNNILSTTYDGCIADVELGGRLFDFGQPTREQGTDVGCPPLEGSCSWICRRNEECVKLWGGSVCNCDGDSCVGGSSAQLSNGYIHLQTSSTINLMSFIIAFRTRSSDATLVQLGAFDSLELKHGSIVYRRSYSSTNMYTPLTLEAFGAVSDGVWHKVRLDINSTHTKLSVDDGRSSASSPEGGAMMITTVTLGAETPESNSSRFSGCLAGVVINSESINLHRALENTLPEYQVSTCTHMVGSGCGRGSPCTDVQCPDNTLCEAGWQNYSCMCSLPNQIMNNECINPCSTNPCKNGGTCETTAFTSAGYQCTCAQGYQPPNCDGVISGGCGLGFFDPPTCNERCLCDPQGADPQQICDNVNGDCVCKAELDVYSASGDLGCQPCDCHALGSMSSKCSEVTGQCVCQENVVGRRCDQCAENFAGMDELGCKAATVVYGSFSFLSLFYERELDNADSTRFKELSQLLSTEIERELYSFTLPGRFEANIEDFSNSSGYVMISYRISNYLPRGSTYLPLPPYSILAGVVQSMVQSGWVGPFQTNSSSHTVPTDCSQVPELCSGCPNTTTSDGLICRAAATCLGEDTDRDRIPDSCDNCPYNFNPNQNRTFCEPVSGVCPGGVASGILWSHASIGIVDIKPCPAPLLGFASRTCLASQQWSEVDVIGCLSIAGQEYLAQAESLDNGQSLSFSQLEQTAAQLEEFTNEQGQTTELFGGDVQVAGRVLDHLLRQLQSYATSEAAGRDEIAALYEDLVSISNNLLSPNPSRGWVGAVKEAEFGPEAFLTTLEQIPVTALDIMWENSLDSSPWEHLFIKTRRPSSTNRNETKISTTLSLSELSASLELPIATPTSSVAIAMFANLGQGLNSYLFNSSSTEPLSVATPILSIQMFNEASKVTTLSASINLTLPYRDKLFLPELRFKAVCAWWQSGVRSGWSTEGCERVSVTLSHVICRCSHLTAFAAILPAAAFQEIIIPPEGFTPHPFTYLIFVIISLLLLATLVLLAVPRHLQNLHNTTYKNLVLALLLTSIVFVVGIDRMEVSGVCGAFSVVLFYLLLSCLSWMVANVIIVARFLLKTPPKEKFVITLYIIGWALPALLSGIAIGIVALVGPSESFLSKFGYPYYCWISVQSFGGFVAPALLLVLVYTVIMLFAIALRVRLRRKKERGRPLSHAATMIRNNTSVVLLKSSSIFLLFLVSWGLGLVAIYLHEETYGDYLQFPFAIFYAVFGVVVFIVLCVNKKVKEAWKLQFEKQPDVIIGQTTGSVYAEIRRPPTNQQRSSRQQQQQQQQHRHHQHHHQNHHRHHGFHNPNHHSSTVQPEQPRREMVELMTIAQPPPHPPPSPTAINSGNLASHSHSHSSPLLNSIDATRGRHQQNQNRSTSERHISENQIQSSLLHVPETRPFSPLTYGSDSGSNISNFDDIDHTPLPPKRTQGVKEEIGGATAPTVVSTIAEDSVGEKEDLSEIPKNSVRHEREARLTSPTLTEIYERARKRSQGTSAGSGTGQDSVLGAVVSGIHQNPLIPAESNGLTVASEDPLWYQNRELGNIESDPMPYETAVRSPPLISPGPISPSLAADESGMRSSPFFPIMSSTTSPCHSNSSATSSSKHSSNNSRSSSRHHRGSPASASPVGLGSPMQEYQRKHSLPVENTKKRSGSSTKNPLYSTSTAVSAKKRSLKKHHRSFNSPKDNQPLPPLPPGVPIHTSPLPPLPRPLESPGSTSPMRKRAAVVRTGSDATRHTHFAPHVSFPHQTDRQPSPRIATMSSRTPPLTHISTPPPTAAPQPYQVSGINKPSALSSSLQPQVGMAGEERRSSSCSNSPARSRQKKKRGLERNDSYHSEGPSAEGKKVNQVIRHSDGSETVQSLV